MQWQLLTVPDLPNQNMLIKMNALQIGTNHHSVIIALTSTPIVPAAAGISVDSRHFAGDHPAQQADQEQNAADLVSILFSIVPVVDEKTNCSTKT